MKLSVPLDRQKFIANKSRGTNFSSFSKQKIIIDTLIINEFDRNLMIQLLTRVTKKKLQTKN